MLELRGVSYRYPGSARFSIEGVDLSVAGGEAVGILGATDAGKSTLCLVASGLAPASMGGELAGDVVLDGASTGIVFQDPATQRSGITGSVFEEVALGPVSLGWPRERSIEAARWALGVLGIEGLAERPPARLSGGQAQLLAIASAMSMRPRHLVLDEPTAHLDPEATSLVVEALARLAAAGVSLLIAEQRAEVLAALCSRVVVLERGSIVLDGAASAVLGDPRLPALGVRV